MLYSVLLLAFACLALAACVAGLTLGLMSLDPLSLEIIMQSNDPVSAAAFPWPTLSASGVTSHRPMTRTRAKQPGPFVASCRGAGFGLRWR